VSITKSSGEAIESSEAVQTPPNSLRWVYAATVAIAAGTNVRIAVTATDRPGGVGDTCTSTQVQVRDFREIALAR